MPVSASIPIQPFVIAASTTLSQGVPAVTVIAAPPHASCDSTRISSRASRMTTPSKGASAARIFDPPPTTSSGVPASSAARISSMNSASVATETRFRTGPPTRMVVRSARCVVTWISLLRPARGGRSRRRLAHDRKSSHERNDDREERVAVTDVVGEEAEQRRPDEERAIADRGDHREAGGGVQRVVGCGAHPYGEAEGGTEPPQHRPPQRHRPARGEPEDREARDREPRAQAQHGHPPEPVEEPGAGEAHDRHRGDEQGEPEGPLVFGHVEPFADAEGEPVIRGAFGEGGRHDDESDHERPGFEPGPAVTTRPALSARQVRAVAVRACFGVRVVGAGVGVVGEEEGDRDGGDDDDGDDHRPHVGGDRYARARQEGPHPGPGDGPQGEATVEMGHDRPAQALFHECSFEVHRHVHRPHPGEGEEEHRAGEERVTREHECDGRGEAHGDGEHRRQHGSPRPEAPHQPARERQGDDRSQRPHEQEQPHLARVETELGLDGGDPRRPTGEHESGSEEYGEHRDHRASHARARRGGFGCHNTLRMEGDTRVILRRRRAMAVTLNEVARAAQVSVSTASLAFSGAGPIADATRDRVLKAAAELGYQGPNPMAASLRRGRTGVIGIVTDDDLRHSFRDPVSVQVLDGIAGALGEAGYGVLLIPRQDPAGTPHPLLRSAAIDAAIMFYAITARDPAIAALRRRKIPMVAMSGNPRGAAMEKVQERRGMRERGDYLRGAGRERIGVATLPYSHARRSGWADLDEAPTYTVTAARLAGIRDAGIEPAAIWECRGSLVDEGIAAGRDVLELTPAPTGLIGVYYVIA